jgi:hypothetical protein
MVDARVPVFDVHILPMFRWIDREHMLLRGLDLTNYDVVRGRSAEILDRLSNEDGPMPTRRTGGPWPKEWLDLFTRWTQTGFQRLALGQGRNFALAKAGNNFRLSCDVDLPDPDARTWLDLKEITSAIIVYRLVLEPTAQAPPVPQTMAVREVIRGPLTVATVVVVDANGEHALAVPVA